MKQEINELDYEYQNYTFEDSDLNLSEQFIALILQQVDDLCENIKSGDPNVPRTLVVNQNLNDAVNCYRISMSNEYFRRKRNRDSIKKENLIHTEDQYELTEENIDFETNETFDDNENEKVPKNRK